MLKVNDLDVRYGNLRAVKAVCMEVREGELVTVIGSNGAGKSTILNSVLGLVRPWEGKIEFMGESIVNLSCHQIVARGLSLIPEERHLFPELTVMENLELGFYNTEDKVQFPIRLSVVFEYFPILKKKKKQMAKTLSGGEQQMVALARGLMQGPKLLMLDEPTQGLAPLMVESLSSIIKELHRSGLTILLVEQNAYMALDLADKAYVLQLGEIIMKETGEKLLRDEWIRKAYLGA